MGVARFTLRSPRPWLCTVLLCLGVLNTATLGGADAATVRKPFRHGLARARARGPYPSMYYRLPSQVYLEPGTIEILRPHCDDAYPMTVLTPCGTATGGPVGGRGS